MKRQHKWLITTLVSVGLCGSFLVGVTYAAYLNRQKSAYPIDFNAGKFTEYFDSGEGTPANPYVITTPAHLRNLQRLTVMGVFSEETTYILGNSITWSGDDLFPIGTEDNPFMGTFNGMGYTISGLTVNGANTNDVGMFGYVHINSFVQNLLLESPTINITNNIAGTYLTTTNPLNSILEDEAKALGEIVPSNLSNNTYTTFGIGTSTGKVPTATADNYPIYTTISDPSWIVETDQGYSVNASHPTTDATGKTLTDKDYVAVQIEAKAFGVINEQVISYTLERWQVNVRGDGNIVQNSDEGGMYAFKTLHQYVDEAGVVEDNHTHPIYAGIFIGHLDGAASYLGLLGNSNDEATNGAIVVSSTGRKVKSDGILVGRSRSDNPLDNSATNYYNKRIEYDPLLREDETIVSSAAMSTNFTTQHNNAKTFTNQFLKDEVVGSDGDTSTSKFFRFYPSVSVVRNREYTYEDDEGVDRTELGNFIRLQDPLSAGVVTRRGLLGTYPTDITVRNGFYIWTSQLTGDGFLNRFFARNDEFEVQVNISYVATGDTTNSFQILYNSYNPNAKVNIFGGAYVCSLNTFPSLADQTVGDTTDPAYVPVSLLENTNQQNRMISKEITFVVDKSSGPFGDLWGALLADSPWYPILAFGVGRTDSLSVPTTGSSAATYITTYEANAFTLDIFEIEVLFTSASGNVSTLVNNVDFLHTTPTATREGYVVTWTDWSKDSGVKMKFDVTVDNYFVRYRFYRVYNRNSTRCYVYGISTSTTYPLTNTDGYKTAQLTNG